MRDTQGLEKDIAELERQLNSKIQHPYLMKYVKEPVVDYDKLFLLTALYQDTTLQISDPKSYIIPIILVQTALDTHEMVETKTVPKSNDYTVKHRQLSVLAGDYYSGLYYQILAEINDFLMINRLAGAIKEINEHKIYVYQTESLSLDKLFESVAIIESELLVQTAAYLGKQNKAANIAEFFLIKRLLAEQQLDDKQKSYSKVWNCVRLHVQTEKSLMDPTRNLEVISNEFNGMIAQRLEKLLKRLKDNHSALDQYLGKRLLEVREQLHEKVLEEG